jgi:ribosomal protein S12 methylthiotransferase
VQQVLIDEVNNERAVARSQADAPEIDGLVYIRDGQRLEPGEFADVRIESAEEYDLAGVLA